MASTIEFGRRIRKRASNVENNAVGLVKKVAKQVLRDLVDGTPVKTGRARSNWRVSVGGTATAIVEPTSRQVTLSEGIAKINSLRVGSLRRGTGEAGTSVRISNNVPYIEKLRNGYSKQQSNDWVAEALLKAESQLSNVRLLERTRDSDDGS